MVVLAVFMALAYRARHSGGKPFGNAVLAPKDFLLMTIDIGSAAERMRPHDSCRELQ